MPIHRSPGMASAVARIFLSIFAVTENRTLLRRQAQMTFLA